MRETRAREKKRRPGAGRRRSPGWTAVLLGAFVLSGTASAERPEPPPYYAIRDVAVMTGDGAKLEGATVVVADGLISAVGTDVEVPADAWVVDGTGLVVYPGLIDAMTTLGQSQAEDDSTRSRGGGSPFGPPGGDQPEIRGPEDRPRTTPWVNAADLLTADDSRVASWREAGFTTALTAPADGFFAGQAALVNLGDGEPGERVVATPVAQRLNFDGRGGFRSFPGSLMGRLSYVKQVFSDARHYARSVKLYEASPNGRPRPAYDRTLATPSAKRSRRACLFSCPPTSDARSTAPWRSPGPTSSSPSSTAAGALTPAWRRSRRAGRRCW